jgi:transcription antitermination factor NusG
VNQESTIAVEKQAAGESTMRLAALRWYACYTRARHEKRVTELLLERGVEAYLPLVGRLRQWHDRRKLVELPLFPSYVFARFRISELGRILATPGVVDVVRFARDPSAIPAAEIDNVRRLTSALRTVHSSAAAPQLVPIIEEGEPVRIVSGPFAGIEGSIAQLRSGNRALIRVGIEIIRQGIQVEVGTASVRPLTYKQCSIPA